MTGSQRNNEVESAALTSTRPVHEQEQGHPVYTYESAGIAERQGNVPIWLWVVVVSLLIWGAYYLHAYWNAPIGQI
jgi:hypothetical protein